MGVFAHRPAPIQVAYLGYSGTSGNPDFDYAIVDPIVVPPDQQPFYSEKLWPLDGCYLPVDARRAPAAAPPSRAACGLPESAFVFCSFNNLYKINPRVFDVWARVLAKVPGSILWLAGGNPGAGENLLREAASRGLDPARLVFAPKLPNISDHLARYGLADLFLDTFPYTASTTAMDALSMGLPILTLSGKSYTARMSESILKAAGLPDLVTMSPEAYEALAVSLAMEGPRLAALKARLTRDLPASMLFDADRHRRNMEAAFDGMMKEKDGL